MPRRRSWPSRSRLPRAPTTTRLTPTTVATTESTAPPETTEATTTSTTEVDDDLELDDHDDVAAPPTTTVDQLKAEVTAALRGLEDKGYALLHESDDSAISTAQIAEIAIPGSPYAAGAGRAGSYKSWSRTIKWSAFNEPNL